ncbi:hypothetical protein C8Q77DRAFT_1108441 [Trametes polyzona]|nr:hypothetical protein C8Q77DRAFT_1108441 [Trametes polyzona]
MTPVPVPFPSSFPRLTPDISPAPALPLLLRRPRSDLPACPAHLYIIAAASAHARVRARAPHRRRSPPRGGGTPGPGMVLPTYRSVTPSHYATPRPALSSARALYTRSSPCARTHAHTLRPRRATSAEPAPELYLVLRVSIQTLAPGPPPLVGRRCGASERLARTRRAAGKERERSAGSTMYLSISPIYSATI